jgi:hypothetical protein
MMQLVVSVGSATACRVNRWPNRVGIKEAMQDMRGMDLAVIAARAVLVVLLAAGTLPATGHAAAPAPRPRPEMPMPGPAIAPEILPPTGAEHDIPPLPQRRPAPDPVVTLDEAPPGDDWVEATPAGSEKPVLPPPPKIYQSACPVVLAGTVDAITLPPIAEGVCRVQSPLLATGLVVGGRDIRFSVPTTLACSLAGQLAAWVARVSAYAEVVFKSPVVEVMTGTSFECRPRNNEAGAQVSEHGFANALDVVGFRLEDGTVLSLPDDWRGDGAEARAMHYAHDAGCGLFTTVLGPETNALHADHLHVDLGCHGATCTYRLCE